MSKRVGCKVWLGQVRAPFLLLSLMLALIGGGAALRDGVFSAWRFALAALGLGLAHVGANLFNELSDHHTGIDQHTRRTPFSGGSGTLQAGLLGRRAVGAVAWGSMLVAGGIGIVLSAVSGWPLVLFVLAGGLASLLYTSHLTRWGLGELAAGLCLGSLAVLGTYYAQAGRLPIGVVLLSVPPGVLTALLLLLNEFPDTAADRLGGRRHLVIVLGHRAAAWLYGLALLATYAFLAAGVLIGWFPRTVLLCLLTMPLGLRAARIAIRRGQEHEAMIPALGSNVALVLGTDLLLAVAYWVDHLMA